MKKGFTLIEIMIVLMILGLMAAIIAPSVSGTKQKGSDARAMSDSVTVQSAVARYNADANTAEKLTTVSTTVLGDAVSIITSNLWPESGISTYSAEFPTNKVNSPNKVAEIEIIWLDSTVTTIAFSVNYNAVSVSSLVTGGYIADAPKSFSTVFNAGQPYHSYLWVLRKVPVGTEATGGRTVELFKLIKIASAGGSYSNADKLTYERIF